MFQVVLNSESGKWEGIANGRVISRTATESLCKSKMIKKFGNVKFEASVPVKPAKSEFGVEERFGFITQFTKLIVKEAITSLIVTGDGGLGKTYTVTNALTQAGLKEDVPEDISGDFIVVKGFSTAKALYRTLFENNGKIIVFDDADSVHKDPIGANILKGALDSGEKRVISWGSDRMDDELPGRFEFYGRVIFISNLPLTKFPQPLLSRSLKVDLTLTTDEKIDRIEQVFAESKDNAKEKQDVLSFIKKYSNKITDLNIRSSMTALKLRIEMGTGWERLALYTMTA